MHIGARVRSVAPPGIELINAQARRLRAAGAPVISLGQALPGLLPDTALLGRIHPLLNEPDSHVYSPVAGLLSVRQAIAAFLAQHNGVTFDPDRELILTAGANQAFMLALLTLLDAGDRVLLPSPYFLNHETTVRIVGGVPVEVPLSPETGFQLRVEDLRPFLGSGARALVIVTPNNPTGAVYDPQEMIRVAEAAIAAGMTVITDEVYQLFVYESARHSSLASVPSLRPHVLTTSSFSKTFGITGWRVGFLAGDATFIEETGKVQDSMVICAPTIGQKFVVAALSGGLDGVLRYREVLDARRRFLTERLARIPCLSWQPTAGSFFAFVRVAGCTDSTRLAHDILEKVHVGTIPGRVFGVYGEGYLRLAYGAVELPLLAEACDRLERYFAEAPGKR
jgi:aminotransferase